LPEEADPMSDANGPGSGPRDDSEGTGSNPDHNERGREACEERRKFLAALSVGIGSVAGVSLLAPWTGLFVTPLLRSDPTAWRDVGAADDFPVGRTLRVTYRDPAPLPWAGYAARNAAWVRRDDENEFSAFTTYCTHVGCAVRWEEGAKLFLCPCHGGAFYADGSVAAGPPPRPLDRYPIRVRDGRVEIRAEGVPAADE